MAPEIELYQIYYHENQKESLYPFATPYFNEGLTPFFENTIISKLIKESQAGKIGVCSHALPQKLKLNFPKGPSSRELTEEKLLGDYDVLAFTINSSKHEMINHAEYHHNGFKDILRRIAAKIGQTIPNKITNVIYQNHFIAKSEIYKRYVAEFLDPAMEIMKNDPEISVSCWKDSGYKIKVTGGPVDFERIEKFIGVNYVPMHPFLCERFFSCWVEGKKFNIQTI